MPIGGWLHGTGSCVGTDQRTLCPASQIRPARKPLATEHQHAPEYAARAANRAVLCAISRTALGVGLACAG